MSPTQIVSESYNFNSSILDSWSGVGNQVCSEVCQSVPFHFFPGSLTKTSNEIQSRFPDADQVGRRYQGADCDVSWTRWISSRNWSRNRMRGNWDTCVRRVSWISAEWYVVLSESESYNAHHIYLQTASIISGHRCAIPHLSGA